MRGACRWAEKLTGQQVPECLLHHFNTLCFFFSERDKEFLEFSVKSVII